MSEEFVLFDIPGKKGLAWSPNVWKVRAVLNYKKVAYKTEWIEFPDIEPKMKELGVPPNPAGEWAPYTVPVLKFPDGSYVMHSSAIVQKLESTNPEPPLRLEMELFEDMEKNVTRKLIGSLVPFLMPLVRRDVVNEASEGWFKKDRERRFGAPEEQYERERGGEVAWQKAAEGQRECAAFLKEHKEDAGPFVLGSTVSYPDFSLAGDCEMFKFFGEEAYNRLVDPVEGLRELHEACKPWFERNDH